MNKMNNSFFLIILICSISINGFSQSLSLSWGGEPIGDTILMTGLVSDYEIVAHAIVTNNSNNSMDIKVRRNALQMINGTFSQFCWGSSCYPPNVEVSPWPLTLGPGQSTGEGQFSAHYLPQGNFGDSFIEYKFFNMNNENVFVKVIVQFAATIVGVDENDLSIKIYPNPVSDHLTINMSQSIEAISIYDCTGAKIREERVKSNSYKLNTSSFTSGIYLFRIATHNRVITKQVVIN